MRRGMPEDAFDGAKPQIAIANTASDLTPCNMHLNDLAAEVQAGCATELRVSALCASAGTRAALGSSSWASQ